MENNKYVVACINGMPPSDSVADYSAWLAKALLKSVKLYHTLDHQSASAPADLSGNLTLGTADELLEELVEVEHEQNRILQKKAKIILEAAKRRLHSNEISDTKICLQHGRLLENLIDLKDVIEAVVIGRFGQNHQNATGKFVGHKVEAVVRSLEKPILVVSKPFNEPSSILLAYDGSAVAEKALNYIIDHQLWKSLDIHVVYVGEKTEKTTAFLDAASLRLHTANYRVTCEYLSGQTDEALLNYISQRDISLIVMGAFSHHWLRNLLMGSFTSKMLSITEIPLFLIR